MSTKGLTRIALSAALLAAVSQLAIPLGGVPLTVQVFGVALCGSLLGKKEGVIAVAVWLLLGAAGVPVFYGFQGGFTHLLGYTGGFLWSFLVLAFCCGFKKSSAGLLGVAACHLLGTVQFALVSGNGPWISWMQASLPYLLKDVLLALVGIGLSKRLGGKI